MNQQSVRCGSKTSRTQEPKDSDSYAPLEVVRSDNFYSGACQLLQLTGAGALRPNTLMVGFKENWKINTPASRFASTDDYVNVLRTAVKLGSPAGSPVVR